MSKLYPETLTVTLDMQQVCDVIASLNASASSDDATATICDDLAADPFHRGEPHTADAVKCRTEASRKRLLALRLATTLDNIYGT